jgi:hypothetical protein
MEKLLAILDTLYQMIKQRFFKKPLFNVQERLPISDKLYPMVKQRLGGKEALDIQKSQEGVGVWFFKVEDNAPLLYIPLNGYLLDVRVTMPTEQKQWLIDEMKTLDKNKEAMVSFYLNKHKSYIGRVNLADED